MRREANIGGDLFRRTTEPRRAASGAVTIIVVEDERAVAANLRTMLEGMGCHVPEIADSRESALVAVAEHQPDLILMDLVLRDGDDGIQTATEIMCGSGVPVLYLTSLADDDLVEQATLTNPLGFLVKPCGPHVLEASIAAALRSIRQERARNPTTRHTEACTRLQAVLLHVPDFILLLDRDGTVAWLNRASQGRVLEDLLGISWLTFIPADRHVELTSVLASVFETGQTAIIEIAATRPDGSASSYSCHLGPVVVKGVVAQVAVVARDTTEVRKSEARVALEQERFRATFEQAPVGIAHVGRDLEVQRANALLAKMLGVGRDELTARGLLSFVHPDDRDGARLAKEVLFAGSDAISAREERWIGTDGPRWVLVTRSLVRDGRGDPSYLVVIVLDIEERKRGEEQLLQAQKLNALGLLAGGVAHDFNNLLTVILTYAELGASDLPVGDPSRADFEHIDIAAQRAVDLTRQLLAFSRRQVLEIRVEDLVGLVRDNKSMLRRLIREDIELVFDIPDEPLLASVDRGQFTQVLFNLILNARDAIPTTGTITLALSEEVSTGRDGQPPAAPCITLSVTDTGVGMSAEIRSRIFEPFFTTKGGGVGTGLGLSTVFGVVTQSGGGIVVDSEPGRGTTFKIYLSRASTSPAGPVSHETEVVRGGETILVVEDDSMVRASAIRILRSGGYRVLEAASPGEALLLTEGHDGDIDLVLTDVVMPRLSGPQLVARLRREGVARFVYMSGHTHAIEPAAASGDVWFLEKPFTPTTLLAMIQRALHRA